LTGELTLGREYLADEQEWQRISPLSLIENADPSFPALYVSNGLYDAYGNFEGSQRLVTRAAELGVRTQWRPLYGGHCATDVASLADFLVDDRTTDLPAEPKPVSGSSAYGDTRRSPDRKAVAAVN
jgi:hypothetical protein